VSILLDASKVDSFPVARTVVGLGLDLDLAEAAAEFRVAGWLVVCANTGTAASARAVIRTGIVVLIEGSLLDFLA
jgi:hypothetical protein